ncbi:unnamed protein product [Natator depressus]
MARLRQLAAQSLEFGNGLEDMLCNCIVSGINNEEAEQSKEEQKQGLIVQGEDSLLHKSEDQHTIPTSR